MTTEYEFWVLKVHENKPDAALALCDELNQLGAEGYGPDLTVISANDGDLVVISRVKPPPPNPAVKVTVTWGKPQPIPKEGM